VLCLVTSAYQYSQDNLQYMLGFSVLLTTLMLGTHTFTMPYSNAVSNVCDMFHFFCVISIIFAHIMYLADDLISDITMSVITTVTIAVPSVSFIVYMVVAICTHSNLWSTVTISKIFRL